MEALLHLTVVLAAALLAGVSPKIGLPVSLFALVPDVDVLLGVHRWFLHSAVVVLAVGVPIALVLRRTGVWRKAAPLACLAALSNPVIDSFWGYTPLLWPLSDQSVWFNIGISLRAGESVAIDSGARILTEPSTFEHLVHFEGPLATSHGIIITAVLLLPIAVKLFREAEA